MAKKLIIGVLASGRGTNLQAIIDNVKSGKLPNVEIGCVISDNPDAKALDRARRAGIPAYYIYPGEKRTVLDPEQEEKYIETLKKHGVELVCLAGLRILKKRFLDAFSNRIMNIHPALLPAFPGLNAQKQALEYGVKVSGATVHFVDEGIDTGPIILQEAVKVEEDDTVETLADRILKVEHKIYSEAIKLFAEGRLKIEGRRVRILSADEVDKT